MPENVMRSATILGMTMIDDKIREMALLGTAIVSAQYVEFAIGGIAAHAGHLPAAQSDKRLRNLSAEAFLRGDPADIKITFGQFVHAFGDAFMIKTDDLTSFIGDRNLIAHHYVRTFQINIKGVDRRDDAIEFLENFIERAQSWRKILQGFIHELMVAAAKKEGREAEIVETEINRSDVKAFYRHVEAYIKESGT